MKLRVLLFAIPCLVLLTAATGWPLAIRTYDPNPGWGGQTKIFYEGWGYGPPVGAHAPDPATRPYRIVEQDGTPVYGRGWTSVGPSSDAWVAYGVNGEKMVPKPITCTLTGSIDRFFEANDWANTDADLGSRAFAGPSYNYATGTYVDGPQPYYNQAVWLDAGGATGNRTPIVLKHDIPTLADPKKVRADVLYHFWKTADRELGYGIRIYFQNIHSSEAYADFALHFYKSSGGYSNISTFGWRVVGIPEHPEWATWTDTPAVMHSVANEHTWKQVAIDCGQILPGGLTFISRTGTEVPDGPDMIAAFLPNFTQYINSATAIAVGQVDETIASQPVGEELWMDDIFVSQGVANQVDTITKSKNSSIANLVQMTGAAVSAVFYGDLVDFPYVGQVAFAIQEPDTGIGVRVTSTTPVEVGDKVDIIGGLATVNGERVITAKLVTVASHNNTAAQPVCMSNRSSGGGLFGFQAAVANNTIGPVWASGLNSIGLLQRLYGKVTYGNETGNYSGYFYLDDGSGLLDGTSHGTTPPVANAGIRCRPAADPDGYALPVPISGNVVVTGVMGTQLIGGINTRFFWTTDVQPL